MVCMRDEPGFAKVLLKKRELAGMIGFSPRTVDKFLAAGMPHLRIGKRRVMLVPDEAVAWLKERYGQRRRAPAARAHTEGGAV